VSYVHSLDGRPRKTDNPWDQLVCTLYGGGRHTREEHERLRCGMGLFYLVAHRGRGFSKADLDNEPLLQQED
jgi:hypothetical protein